MNVVREINRINERELELGLNGASWHDDYKDSAYIFAGGLPFELTEGDVITIFSQFGEIVDVNMPRDKETGKPRGFAFVMYEDQRSTVLAVDNMNGGKVLGRTVRVDHVRDYKQPGGKKGEDGVFVPPEAPSMNAMPRVSGEGSAGSGSESGDSVDDEDPMAEYLRAQRKASGSSSKKKRKHEGESKEERRARKEAKRAKKAAKSQKGKDDDAHRVKKETGREKNEYDGLAEQFGREDSSKARSRDRYEGDHARNRRHHDGSKQHAEVDRDRRATSTRALQEHERGGDRERDRDRIASSYNRSPDRHRERPYDDDPSRDVRSRINERMYA